MPLRNGAREVTKASISLTVELHLQSGVWSPSLRNVWCKMLSGWTACARESRWIVRPFLAGRSQG
jgi:hypothetical protein